MGRRPVRTQVTDFRTTLASVLVVAGVQQWRDECHIFALQLQSCLREI